MKVPEQRAEPVRNAADVVAMLSDAFSALVDLRATDHVVADRILGAARDQLTLLQTSHRNYPGEAFAAAPFPETT